MRKVYKIAIILLIIINVYSVFSVVNAMENIWITGNEFLNAGMDSTGLLDKVNDNTMRLKMKEIVDFLWGIGLLVVFISTIALGIRYMLVLPNERSRIKQATTPYILGVVIIFGAVTIWKLIIDILEGSMLGPIE